MTFTISTVRNMTFELGWRTQLDPQCDRFDEGFFYGQNGTFGHIIVPMCYCGGTKRLWQGLIVVKTDKHGISFGRDASEKATDLRCWF